MGFLYVGDKGNMLRPLHVHTGPLFFRASDEIPFFPPRTKLVFFTFVFFLSFTRLWVLRCSRGNRQFREEPRLSGTVRGIRFWAKDFGKKGSWGPARIFSLRENNNHYEMSPTDSAPSCGGKGDSSLNYGKQVKLCCQVTKSEPAKGASALILPMATVARQV